MSMDPSKWVPYDKLSADSRKKIEELYPYLKMDGCSFQEKESGVFMRHGNGVKVEKLLDEPNQPPGRGNQKSQRSGGKAGNSGSSGGSSRSRKQQSS